MLVTLPLKITTDRNRDELANDFENSSLESARLPRCRVPSDHSGPRA